MTGPELAAALAIAFVVVMLAGPSVRRMLAGKERPPAYEPKRELPLLADSRFAQRAGLRDKRCAQCRYWHWQRGQEAIKANPAFFRATQWLSPEQMSRAGTGAAPCDLAHEHNGDGRAYAEYVRTRDGARLCEACAAAADDAGDRVEDMATGAPTDPSSNVENAPPDNPLARYGRPIDWSEFGACMHPQGPHDEGPENTHSDYACEKWT